MSIDFSLEINKILISFLIFIEILLSWKIAHLLKILKKSNENDDLDSKIIVGLIMITLLFMFQFSTFIIHTLVTNEPLNPNLLFLTFILLIGYLASLFALSRLFRIKLGTKLSNNKIYKKSKSEHN